MMSDINSGLLNDVLIVGNELSGKLNEIGVSNTFGRASEGKDDLVSLIRMAIDGIDMVVDEKSYVSLTATNPYMLTGETTDIVAKFRNGVCKPLTNKNVTIEQSVFIDDGVTGDTNSNWYRNGGTDNKTVTVNGTTLANTTSTRYDIFAYYGTAYDIYVFQSPFIVEFDIVNYTISGSNRAKLQIYDKDTNIQYNVVDGVGHYKIVCDGTTCMTYKNGVKVNEESKNIQNARVGFTIQTDCSITYKNFVIYKTIKGVTDGNGEFALNDVSVTDYTTFTATYETVNSNKVTVYPCIYRDYATSDTNSKYYINSVGGTSLTWNNGYLVLSLGSSARYARLKTNQYDVNNLIGKKVHFEAEIDADTSCYVQLLDDSTGNVYTRATGNEITKGVSQLDYVIPSNCTQVLFQIVPKDLTGSGGTIKFKNFVVY